MSRIVRVIVFAVACAGLQANRAAGQVTSLVILVHDTAGHPMAKAQIGVLNVDNEYQPPPAITDSLGRFLLCSVVPGQYRVSARVKGYLPWIGNHVVPVASADTLRVVLRIGTLPEEGGYRIRAATPAPAPVEAPQRSSCEPKQ